MSVVKSKYFTRSSSRSTKQSRKHLVNGQLSIFSEKKNKQTKVFDGLVKQESSGLSADASVVSVNSPQVKTRRIQVKVESDTEETPCANYKKWEPDLWKEQFSNIRKMREAMDAPVDTMGCERCTDDKYSEKDKRFHILTSLMLSSQTKDQVTHSAMLKLIEYGLTPDAIQGMSEKQLGDMIYPVGFWKKKVVYLKKTADILTRDYGGDIPGTVDDLIKLPGVGPKMAYLAMNCAWKKVVGIGVDVHVHRIANRLKWVRKPTTDPEKTRKELEDWLPQYSLLTNPLV